MQEKNKSEKASCFVLITQSDVLALGRHCLSSSLHSAWKGFVPVSADIENCLQPMHPQVFHANAHSSNDSLPAQLRHLVDQRDGQIRWGVALLSKMPFKSAGGWNAVGCATGSPDVGKETGARACGFTNPLDPAAGAGDHVDNVYGCTSESASDRE